MNRKDSLEQLLEAMARKHGLQHIQDHFDHGRFDGPNQERVARWLRRRRLIAAMPLVGKFAVGAATIVLALVGVVQLFK